MIKNALFPLPGLFLSVPVCKSRMGEGGEQSFFDARMFRFQGFYVLFHVLSLGMPVRGTGTFRYGEMGALGIAPYVSLREV